MERQILKALLAEKVSERIKNFIDEHANDICELEMNPVEVESLIWELLSEAIELRKHKD